MSQGLGSINPQRSNAIAQRVANTLHTMLGDEVVRQTESKPLGI
ncbi:MAG: hypothetical protein AB8B91_01810 [Rubripirellula sp.]